MSPRPSAGIVVYRRRADAVEVLLGHLGGPYWAKKDDGAWSIPKGEVEDGEDLLAVARREFAEETAYPLPAGELIELGTHRYRSGKELSAWAVAGDLDAAGAVSNTFEMEWPPHSGRRASFPELDRFDWFVLPQARLKVSAGQRSVLDALAARLAQVSEPDL